MAIENLLFSGLCSEKIDDLAPNNVHHESSLGDSQ